MEFTRRTMMAAGAVLAAPNFATLAQAEAQAPANRQTLDTRVGKLELINGFPTDETVAKVYDEMDFQRAVQGYLWALPIMAMCEWQRQSHETFGASNFDYVDYFDFKDKLGILTANATTPYAQAFPNMKDTGPLVVEIPAGPTAGGILDFWQRPLTDTGQTGPEKGKGAKFLVLGPDHPDVKPNGFIVVRSPTWNIWSGQRGVGDDIEKAQALVASMRIYPYSQRDKPPAAKPVRPGDKKWSAAQPRGIDYWIGLARMIDQEPAIERDRLMLAMLRPLGIEKGKPFKPDQRQTKILIDAAQLGEIMARANSYAKRFEGSRVWPNRRWEFSLFLENVTQEFSELHPARRARFLVLRSRRRDRRDARTHRRLRPSLSRIPKGRRRHLARRRQTYRLRVPPDAPVAQFWSFSVYDNESRCLIDTGSYPDRSSRDDIVKNADGSIDLYFGPKPPVADREKNWIKTLPAKGWFTYFRLYGPTQPFFDRKTTALRGVIALRNNPPITHRDSHRTPRFRRRTGVLDLQLRRILSIGLHGDQRRGAVIGRAGDAAADAAAVRHDRQALRPHAQQPPVAGLPGAAHRQAQAPEVHDHAFGVAADHDHRQQHAASDKARDHLARGLGIERARRRRLLDAPGVHHRNTISQRQGFGLVVGDVDEGRADLLVEARKLLLHRLAQMHVEIGERLVEQHDVGAHGEAARERDALALTTGKLMRAALGQRFEPDHGERPVHAAHALLLGDPAHTQRERDVLRDVHVRPQRIGLEHHADVPLLRRQRPTGAADHGVAELHDAAVGHLEARHQPQQRGLAAAGRPEQREELAVGDVEAHALDGAGLAEMPRHGLERHARHGTTPSGRLRAMRLVRIASASVTAIEITATAAAAGELPS